MTMPSATNLVSLWRWPRLLLALLITFAALPYPYGRFLVFALQGAVDVRLAGGIALAVLALIVLTWRVRLPLGGVGILAVWCASIAGLIAWVAAPRMPLWQLLAVFVPGTIWVVWLAWFTAWPFRFAWRSVLLVFFLGLGAAAAYVIRIDGMTGDTTTKSPTFLFAWRQHRDQELVQAADRADLKPSSADDFPQFLGPKRTGVLDTKIAGDWNAAPPRELWRRSVGTGWGGFAIAGGYAFTQEQRGPDECVTCYRLADGKPIWIHRDSARYEGIGGPGPRATPSVHEGRVYSVGATGIVNCLEAATGECAWSVDLLRAFDTGNSTHGVCASPLIDGDRVIVCPPCRSGPTLAALNRVTGERLWQSGDSRSSYSSPMVAELCGVPQLLLYDSAGVGGYDRSSGRPLWHFDWANHENISASQPIANGETVLAATGYGKGIIAVALSPVEASPWDLKPLWSNLRLKTKFTTPIMFGNHLYGLDDGVLACLDPATGRLKWKDGRYGHGQILLAGNRLVVQAEGGDVVLVEPSPVRLIERGRLAGLTGKTWNNPALSGRYLLLRNDREAASFELPPP